MHCPQMPLPGLGRGQQRIIASDEDMIESVEELRTFVRIVAAGSFSRAAASMGVTLDAASKRLNALEKRTGVKLINRTTRALAATDEGRELYERAEIILKSIEDAETVLRGGKVATMGLLRVSAPVDFGVRHVSPVCASFAKENSGISLDLVLTDRPVDLVEERVDVCIRYGDLRHPAAVVHKLVDNDRVVVCTPGYVVEHGMPSTPDELVRHNCLTAAKNEATWRLVGRKGERSEVRISSRIKCNSGIGADVLLFAGNGLMLKDRIDVAEEVSAGRLVRLLEYWRSPPAPLFALYVANEKPPTKVKMFVALLEKRLAHLSGVDGGSV